MDFTINEEIYNVVDDNNVIKLRKNEENTVAKAARYLGRSIEQVSRYLREGNLAGYRVGNQWFIPAEALASFNLVSGAQEESMKLTKEMRALREQLRRKYGYLDVNDWVSETREGLL